MSKFNYMMFYGGFDEDEFVVHAKKFTKKEAIEKMFFEIVGGESEKIDEILAICKEKTVRYFVQAPLTVEDYDGYYSGCYSYCKEGERGSFPVWAFVMKDVNKILGIKE